jgi:hypothetical protein
MWDYGCEWTAYVEWIEFLRDVAGYERDGRVDFAKWFPYRDATLHGGVRVMHEKFCIVADRPEYIKTIPRGKNSVGDDVQQLHCLNGPAKRYRDGWSIYAVHGVRVPAQIIEAPETITAEQIQAERNAEVRRVMIDRFGAARYLRAIGAEVVHEDSDQHGFPRRLLRCDLPGDVEPLQMVEVVNSTPEPIGYRPDEGAAGIWRGSRWFKIYTLRVPPSVTTAGAALAWTFELPAEADYAPAVET